MLTIRSIVVKNMSRITRIMVVILLVISTVIQILATQQTGTQNALQIFSQVEQILDENSRELERTQKEYETMCLNDARMAAYILKHNPEAGDDIEELRKIAANLDVDEIHIFDKEGVIVTGTHPEYFGYSFDSGEQMSFFKPLLKDKSLELVQEVTPNTASGKMVQYSALWSEDGEFIVQIGMNPSNVLRATNRNGLSYIFSLLRTGVGYSLYAVDPDAEKVVGATVLADLDKDIGMIGLQPGQLESRHAFYAKVNQKLSYCLSKKIGENSVIWVMPIASSCKSILVNELLMLAGLLLISLILVDAVGSIMNRTVVGQIQEINGRLRLIQEGNLQIRVAVEGSKEFSELSAHINSMVDSLLQNAEKLELSEQIKAQKEELEKQQEQLKIAVKRANVANEAKSEFLFNMSHDIRTPMNAILGFTNLALESGDPKTQREYLKNIDISSKQLLDLINNILELSKIESNKVTIEENLVNANETFNKLCTIFDSDLKKKHLTYAVKRAIKHPYIYMDTTHYSQIFMNVVSNAIKYTPDGGEITISFRELPGEGADTCIMETVVEDSGIGISREFLAHVYESFARERTSTISRVQGSGLGLPIAKNLVDLMRGEIGIESQQGEGTKVTIRIPHRLGETPAARKLKEMETLDYVSFEGKRILLAEDIDINAMIAMKLLSSKGFVVARAKDGVECVDMLLKAEEGYYDLVLMDIQMPNMDGYEATRTIRAFGDEKKASIPILAMTANAFKEDRDKAADVGMNGHIAKPIDAAKMFGQIAEVLKGNG